MGDLVQTVSLDEQHTVTWTPVLSWLHVDFKANASYLALDFGNGARVRLADDHLLLVWTSQGTLRSARANEVALGEYVWTTQFGKQPLVRTSRVDSVGYYNFLTEAGTVVVDGVLCSCFASGNHFVKNAAWDLFRVYRMLFPFKGAREAAPGFTMLSQLSRLLGDFTDALEGKPTSAWTWIWPSQSSIQ